MSVETPSLRNVNVSGGLFTENILVKLRDHPEQLDIGKLDENLIVITREDISKKENEIRNIICDLRETWFKISESIEKLSADQFYDAWLYPLFSSLGFQLEKYQETRSWDQEDEVDALSRFSITHQSMGQKNPLFHLVPSNDEFDSNIQDNPSKKSHHDVCQVFINGIQGIKWLILTNGRIIRLLTKYYHSYSRGYVEFNIENILSKNDEKEFLLFYRMIHISRFTLVQEEKSTIDAFQEFSTEQGVKIGEDLRNNVHDVLELLGDELILQNKRLFEDMRNGVVKPETLYHELLQVLYRIIFILYAEKREMLPSASSLFFKQFSLSTLRLQAERPIKRDQNVDLWNKLFILFKIVKDGNVFLDVNAFNGNLFDESNHTIITTYKLKLSNDSLLKVVRELTTAKIGNNRQRINFLEVSVEEIGSIYESLLDYQPRFENDKFFLFISEEARKKSGSYYTSKDIVRLMIERTIIPYIEKIIEDPGISTEEKINRILDIKICDPACGGGSFLIATLDIMGIILARVESGLNEPPKLTLESARRKILENCIFGVDINSFALELTKLSLWIHACVNDKPLNFLDHHIKSEENAIC